MNSMNSSDETEQTPDTLQPFVMPSSEELRKMPGEVAHKFLMRQLRENARIAREKAEAEKQRALKDE